MFTVKRNILNIVSLIVSGCFLFLLISYVLEKSNLKEKSGYSNHRMKDISKQIINQQNETLQKYDNAILKTTPKSSEFDSIYVIDQEKLKILLTLKIPLILAYFSPWCGHCKHFIPLFIEFANDYRLHHPFDSHGDYGIDGIGNNTNDNYTNNNSIKNKEEINIENLFGYNIRQNKFIFGTIDCTAEKKLCQKIESTPMVLAQYYKKGTLVSGIFFSL
jgi:thiol-disulfide isomerase/thioredoxin